jgi:membrane associated rhomboid family serine protease
MAYSDRSYARPYIGVPGLPTAIKWLIISNVAVFLIQSFSPSSLRLLLDYFALTPAAVVRHGFVWQLGTYLFIHGGIWHILFNMLALWMFGADIEQTWGTRRFLKFYFFCGIGAGLCVVLLNYIFTPAAVGIPTVGASGAIYGILMACAILWPDRIVLMSFLFPIKMKYFVMIFGAIAFLNSFSVNSGVSEFAHLGGMAFAFLFIKTPRMRGVDPVGALRDSYKSWKLQRAKKKFQVYLRKKQGSERGPWVN